MTQVYVPKASDWIGAFEAGQQGAMTRRKEEGARQIGGLMASGDYKGAAAAAYGSGEYATGSQLETLGSQRDTAARRQALGQRLAGGDAAGAAQEALQSGDLDYYKELDGIADAQKLEKAKAFGGILRAIGSEPEDAWDDLILANRAQLEALDIPADEIDFFAKAAPEQRRVLMSTMLSRADMLDKYLDDRRADTKPDWKEIKNADGSTQWVDFNDRNGGGQAQPQAPGAQMAGGGAGFDAHIGGVLQREGGFVASDGDSGAPANFGINQRANPDVDVRNLTEEQAKQLYKTRYWDAIQGDQLPPQAQAAVFDAAVNQGVGAAKEMWSQAGGDVQKFNELRLQRYRQTKGYDKYGEVWERRVAETSGPAPSRQMASAPSGSAAEPVLAGGAGADAVQPYQVASAGATPPPPGQRTRPGSAAPRREWEDLPGGGQVNIRTGEKKNMPGVDSGPALDPATGLTPIGDPRQGVYRNAVGQKFQTNRAGTVQRLSGPTDTAVQDTEKRIKSINETMALVDAVDEQLAKTRVLGPGGRYLVNQEEFAMLDSLTKQLQIAYKNAAELGAITGPDVPFIESVAPNPRELRALVQRGEFAPRLRGLAKVAGTKYRGETAAFRSLGGDPKGLTPLYRSPRSNVPYDNEGKKTGQPAAGKVDPARKAALIREAKEAISAGAPRAAVIQELRKMGVNEGI